MLTGVTLDSTGTITISGNSSISLSNSNILNRGNLTINGNYTIVQSSTSAMANFGQMTLAPSSTVLLSLRFNNSMNVNIGDGTSVKFAGNVVNSGNIQVGNGGLMTCDSAVYTFSNTSALSGNGTLQFSNGVISLYLLQ
jgi:hypothetical protein